MYVASAHLHRQSKVKSAVAWTALGFGAQKLLQFASNLLLTRLLFPEAFGLMALANVALVGLQMFSDIGIKPAIVQSDDGESEALLNTAWTIQVTRGFVLAIAACAIAYPASTLYDEPVLWPLLSVLSISVAINGFQSISMATSQRQLNAGRLAILNIIGQIVALAVNTYMSWAHRTVWALAYGAIAGALATTILSHVLMPSHKHRLVFDKKSTAKLLSFGRWIFLSTALTFIGGQGLRAIQGLFVDTTALGTIAIAQTIAWMPGEFAAHLMNMVGFPALAEIRRQSMAAMTTALHSAHAKLLLMSLPIFLAVALFSNSIIDVLYDDRYAEAGTYLAILSLSGALSMIPLGYQNAVMATGDSKLHFRYMAWTMSARLVGSIAGFRVGGVNGMLAGVGVGTAAGYIALYARTKSMGLICWRRDALACTAVATASLICWVVQ